MKAGPEPGANSSLFVRYLLTKTTFHHDLQMDQKGRESIGPL